MNSPMKTVLDELSVFDIVVEQTLSTSYEKMLEGENGELTNLLYPTRKEFDEAFIEHVKKTVKVLISNYIDVYGKTGEELLKQNANLKKVL